MTTRIIDRVDVAAKAAGLSDNAIYREAGLPKGLLTNARKSDSGKVSADTLAKLAPLLGRTVGELLGEAAPAPAAAPADATMRRIPFLHLVRSPLNPRRTFDELAIAELAESIAVQGLLQNLVVRRDGDTERYVIVAGERRFRAIEMLYRDNRAPADLAGGVPCKVVEADESEHLALALLENLARVDVNPAEEAEGFATLQDLDPERWTTEAIARAIGKIRVTGDEDADRAELRSGMRFVQQRLALVRKLVPAAMDRLRAGELSFSQARVLASVPAAMQATALPQIGANTSADSLRSHLIRDLIPFAKAFFDASLYQGEVVEDDTGARFFADAKEFERLQMAEVQASRQRYQAGGWPWVEVLSRGDHFNSWDYETGPKAKGAGIVIDVGWDWTVKIHKNLVPKAKAAAKGTPVAPEAKPVTDGHLAHARRRKTAALQEAVAANPTEAMRVACLGLLGCSTAVHIKAECHEGQDEVYAAGPRRLVESYFPALASCTANRRTWQIGREGPVCRHEQYYAAGIDQAAVWELLTSLDNTDLQQLFGALVALRVGSFNGYQPQLGDEPVVLAIAADLGLVGAEADIGLALQPDDLKGVRKDTLLSIARLAEVEGKINDMKVADLTGYIAGQAAPGFVMPSLRFADRKTAETLFAGHGRPLAAVPPDSAKPALSREQLFDQLARSVASGQLALATPTDVEEVLAAGIRILNGWGPERAIPADAVWDPDGGLGLGAGEVVEWLFGLEEAALVDPSVFATIADVVAWVCAMKSIALDQAAE